jgi:gliding motility-associated-like protein
MRGQAQLKAAFSVSQASRACFAVTENLINQTTGASPSAIYIWNFGNGVKTTTYALKTTPSITYTATQVYTITLVVSDNGKSDTAVEQFTVPNLLAANFTVSTSSACLPMTTTFSSTTRLGAEGIDSYFWDFGDGTTLTTKDASVTHTYTAMGSGFVTFIATDSAKCGSVIQKTGVVSFSKAVQPSFYTDAPGTGVGSSHIVFSNTTVGSGALQYAWDFGDGSTSAEVNPSHTFTQSGAYPVRLHVSSPTGCSGTATNEVYVGMLPIPRVGVSASFTYKTKFLVGNACLPEVFDFTSKTQHVVRASWDFGDGSSDRDDLNPSHTYSKAGKYLVTMTAVGTDSTIVVYQDSINAYSPYGSVKVSATYSCTAAEITLTADIHNASSGTWNFGDGTTQAGMEPVVTHFYSKPGVFIPSIGLHDSVGCSASLPTATPITIDSLHAAFPLGPTLVCDSMPLAFAPSIYSIASGNKGEVIRYHWNFGTGNPGDTAQIQTPSFTYRAPGAYTATLQMLSSGGCSYTAYDTIHVSGAYKATFTGPAEVCAGVPTTYAVVPGISAPVTYSWLMPGGGTDTGLTVHAPAPAAGAYTTRLVTKHDWCYDTSSAHLVVDALPQIAVSASAPWICLGNSVSLSIQAGTGVAYHWAQGGSSASPRVERPGVTTTYTVDAINTAGCTRADSVSVLVVTPQHVSLAADTFVCIGSSLTLAPTGADVYNWIPAGLTQPTLTVAPTTDTTYSVSGSDQHSCFSDTARVLVHVEPLPTVHTTPVGALPAGNSITLNATGSPDVVAWAWTPDEYLSCAHCSAPDATPQASMTYTVTGSTQYGCSATDTVSIRLVCFEDRVAIPNAFTPNHDGFNDVFYARGRGVKVIQSMRIYGRWGNLVFERQNIPLDDPGSGWDGTAAGMPQPTGSYIYEMVIVCETGDVFIKKGTVLLER